MPTFAATQRGYENLWRSATVLPSYKARAQAAAKKIIGLKWLYQEAEKATGAAWWWIGCVHYREADCNPKGCLANGELIIGTGRRTMIVPKGRGPYGTFSESAVDALRYEGLTKPQSSVAWYLWAAEKINGYVAARNSSYIWAGTTKMSHGMWVRDHVFDRSKDDPRPGVAAIMKELFEIDPSLEPKAAAPVSPIVVGGAASIPAVSGSIHLGDPSYAIGAAVALAIILAAYAVQNSGVGRMNSIIANWRTTTFGSGALMVAIWQLVGMIMGTTPVDPATVGTVVMAVLSGLIGIVAKDGNVTGGTVRQ